MKLKQPLLHRAHVCKIQVSMGYKFQSAYFCGNRKSFIKIIILHVLNVAFYKYI